MHATAGLKYFNFQKVINAVESNFIKPTGLQDRINITLLRRAQIVSIVRGTIIHFVLIFSKVFPSTRYKSRCDVRQSTYDSCLALLLVNLFLTSIIPQSSYTRYWFQFDKCSEWRKTKGKSFGTCHFTTIIALFFHHGSTHGVSATY